MDRGRCLTILALHRVGLRMRRLICNFWDMAMTVCRAKGNYGRPFKAGRGVTQGPPLLAKLFNIIVNAVVREWLRLMRKMLDDLGGYLSTQIEALFAYFMWTTNTSRRETRSSFRRPSTSLSRRSNALASPPTRKRRRQWCARQGRYGSNSQPTRIDI
jgi:hypothetical protein